MPSATAIRAQWNHSRIRPRIRSFSARPLPASAVTAPDASPSPLRRKAWKRHGANRFAACRLVEPPPRSWYHADQAERYWRTLPVVLEHEHYAPSKSTKAWSQELLVKSVEDHHASYMSIHGNPKKLLDENRAAFEKIARRLGCRFVPQKVAWPDAVKVGKKGETFAVSFSFVNRGVAPCYRDAYPCLTIKDGKGRILAVLADSGFNLKGLLPDVLKEHVARFRLGRFGAPTFPASGTFEVYLSVGEADGTPVYELPLGDSDGQRRYKVGTLRI